MEDMHARGRDDDQHRRVNKGGGESNAKDLQERYFKRAETIFYSACNLLNQTT